MDRACGPRARVAQACARIQARSRGLAAWRFRVPRHAFAVVTVVRWRPQVLTPPENGRKMAAASTADVAPQALRQAEVKVRYGRSASYGIVDVLGRDPEHHVS